MRQVLGVETISGVKTHIHREAAYKWEDNHNCRFSPRCERFEHHIEIPSPGVLYQEDEMRPQTI